MKNPKDIFQYGLGIMIVLCFFMLIGFLLYKDIPTENKEMLYIAVGALIASFTTVKDYFFGSSSGSAKKGETIEKQNQEIKELINPSPDQEKGEIQ